MTAPARLLAALLLAASLLGAPACDPQQAEEDEGTDYLGVNAMLMESMELSLRRKDLHRAKALAVMAMEVAGDDERLRAAAELGAAMAERARGDMDAFLRHVDRAIVKIAVEDRATGVVIEAAKTRARRGDVAGARDMLQAWQGRARDERRERDEDRAREAEEELPPQEVEPEPPAPEGEDVPARRRPATPQYPIVVP